MYTMTKEQVERRDKEVAQITETLKTMKNATSSELSELTGIKQDRLKYLMKRVILPANAFPISSRGRKGYIWNEQENSEEVDRYPETKNHEGYSDPTAYKAMKNTEQTQCRPGEIWAFETYDGSEEDGIMDS